MVENSQQDLNQWLNLQERHLCNFMFEHIKQQVLVVYPLAED